MAWCLVKCSVVFLDWYLVKYTIRLHGVVLS